MEIALEAGADDIQALGRALRGLHHAAAPTRPCCRRSRRPGIEPDEAEVGKYADNSITLEGAKAQQMLKLMEALEDHDDVQNVWANFDISDKEMEAAAAAS